MKQLTIEHLAAYLPYQPLMGWHDEGHRCIIDIQMMAKHGVGLANYRPILRPLSALTEPITHNGDTFVPIEVLKAEHPHAFNFYSKLDSGDSNDLPYSQMKRMLEWHFDIFGLIEVGLAIDINTLAK